MTTFCTHPGCLNPLHAANLSGVCRAHIHGPACQCARCRAHPSPAQRRHAFAITMLTRTEPPADTLPFTR